MVYCSFCGKSQEEVKKIIAGNNAFICNECVELAQEIIREELAEEVLADLSEVPKPIELLNILNHYVIGQDRAKRALAVAVKLVLFRRFLAVFRNFRACLHAVQLDAVHRKFIVIAKGELQLILFLHPAGGRVIGRVQPGAEGIGCLPQRFGLLGHGAGVPQRNDEHRRKNHQQQERHQHFHNGLAALIL